MDNKRIKQTLNYCLDLACVTPEESRRIHEFYKRFSIFLPEEFSFSLRLKNSKVFYIALNYGALLSNYIGYSCQDANSIKKNDSSSTFISCLDMERFLGEYLESIKINRYTKNIKITLELIKHT